MLNRLPHTRAVYQIMTAKQQSKLYIKFKHKLAWMWGAAVTSSGYQDALAVLFMSHKQDQSNKDKKLLSFIILLRETKVQHVCRRSRRGNKLRSSAIQEVG